MTTPTPEQVAALEDLALGQLGSVREALFALIASWREGQKAAATWRTCPACQYEWRVPNLPAGESNDCPICTLTDAHLESEQATAAARDAALARAEQAERARDDLKSLVQAIAAVARGHVVTEAQRDDALAVIGPLVAERDAARAEAAKAKAEQAKCKQALDHEEWLRLHRGEAQK